MVDPKDVLQFKLNNGAWMPAIGLGTGSMGEAAEVVEAGVLQAIENGYRHFDTAAVYGTEAALGAALQEAFKRGIVNREDVFVTTKIGVQDVDPPLVLPAIQKSLSQLQLDYLDLYLIHWPVRIRQDTTHSFMMLTEDDFLPLDMKGVWQEMEKLVHMGLTKAIGVSNFEVKRLQELLPHATIIPAVNQVELHPHLQHAKLKAYCDKKGIQITAWSPLAAYQYSYGGKDLMQNPILKDIAENHGKSVPQITLRWITESGFAAVPKTYNKDRQIQNLSIFEFNLTEEDHQKIKTINQKRLCDFSPIYKGPWKTPEEFWDDEE